MIIECGEVRDKDLEKVAKDVARLDDCRDEPGNNTYVRGKLSNFIQEDVKAKIEELAMFASTVVVTGKDQIFMRFQASLASFELYVLSQGAANQFVQKKKEAGYQFEDFSALCDTQQTNYIGKHIISDVNNPGRWYWPWIHSNGIVTIMGVDDTGDSQGVRIPSVRLSTKNMYKIGFKIRPKLYKSL